VFTNYVNHEGFRKIAKTVNNTHSSRSHTIFRMVIERKDEKKVDSMSSPDPKYKIHIANAKFYRLILNKKKTKTTIVRVGHLVSVTSS
jgi:hypothetical protein